MSRSGAKSADTYARQAEDWYVEPEWCTELLLGAIDFNQTIYDPAMGLGNILKVCQRADYDVWGTDIHDRGGCGFTYVKDFVQHQNTRVDNIITNPPYKLAQKFIEQGLPTVYCKLAVLVRLEFLASQKRNPFFKQNPPTKILVLSRRPSMPPGELYDPDKEARGGTLDYCWIVWDKQSDAPTTVEWLL